MNILLTVEELAKYLKVKPDTIYKKVRKGELPAIKLGKLVRFPKDLIDQWIIEQATKTMKDVRAAKDAVEARVEEAVGEVRKTAKAASKTLGEHVPDVFEEVKKAPLNKKQAVLTKGLLTLWKDFNSEMHPKKARKSTKTRTTKKSKTKSTNRKRKANGRSGAIKMAGQPSGQSLHN